MGSWVLNQVQHCTHCYFHHSSLRHILPGLVAVSIEGNVNLEGMKRSHPTTSILFSDSDKVGDCVWEIKCAIQMSCNCSQKALWKPATDLKLSIKALTSSELLSSVPTGPLCVTLEHQLRACWLQCSSCEFQVKCVPYVHPCWATAGVRRAGPHGIRHHRIPQIPTELERLWSAELYTFGL